MKRALCVMLVLAVAGSAFAAAVKIKDFTVTNEPAGATAMAILNYTSGPTPKFIAQVTVSGFTPNTTYDIVWLSPSQGDWISPGALVTDENGDGHVHLTAASLDLTDSTVSIQLNGVAHAVGSPAP